MRGLVPPYSAETRFLHQVGSNLQQVRTQVVTTAFLLLCDDDFSVRVKHVVVVVVGYPTPSEGWGHGGRPWSPRSRATPQGLDQRS